MRVRSVVVFVLPLAVGACTRSSRCCDPCPSSGAGPRYAPVPAPTSVLGPVAPVAPRKPRASLETLRLQAALLVKEVEKLDATARGARVGEALAKEPRLVEGLSPGAWAALAPDSLRVYDLSRLVEIAPDLPAPAIDPLTPHEGPEDAVDDKTDPRIARFANELRTMLTEASIYVHPAGAVLVTSRSEHAAKVDAAIESAARVGSGVARLDIDLESVLPDDMAKRLGIGVADGPWKAGAALPESGPMAGSLSPPVYVRADAPAIPATPMHLGVGVPSGSRFGSKHTTKTAYLQDFDGVGPGDSGPVDPIVGTIEAGTMVNVTHRPATATGPGSLVVELAFSELVEPIPTFQTTLANVSEAVTIDLPELRLVRRSIAMPAVAGMAAFIDLKFAAFYVRVASIERTPPPTGPLVRRVAAGEPDAKSPRPPAAEDVTFHVGVSRAAAPVGGVFGGGSARLSLILKTEVGSTASLSTTNPISYIRDFDVELACPAMIGDPIIGNAEPGFEVSVRPRRAEGGRIVVASSIRIEDLDAPLRRVRVPLGAGTPVTIELPRTHLVVESSVASFAAGETNQWTLNGPAGRADVVVVDFRLGGPDAPSPATAPAPAALPVPAK